MEEAGTDAREGSSTKRSSMGFAGMFPFLQQRASFDTDQAERLRKAGGKIKPGASFDKQLMRAASGDLPAPLDSPSAATPEGSPSPKPSWMAAAAGGGRDGALINQSWPGPGSQANPGKGLFSKLMSKKGRKQQDAASPAAPGSPTLGSSPCLQGISIGTGFRASSSAGGGSGGGAEDDDGCPCTPPTTKAAANHHASDEGEFVSCYATPAGSEVMQSPASNLFPEGFSASDTLDLRQITFDADGEAMPGLALQQDLPQLFTPGFNQLLQQAGGRVQGGDCSPEGSCNLDEPTVALLSTAQLAQAGCMQHQSPMLLEPRQEQPASPAEAQAGAEATVASGEVSCLTEQQRIIAAAVAAAKAANQQKQLPRQEREEEAVSAADIQLEMAEAEPGADNGEAEVAASASEADLAVDSKAAVDDEAAVDDAPAEPEAPSAAAAEEDVAGLAAAPVEEASEPGAALPDAVEQQAEPPASPLERLQEVEAQAAAGSDEAAASSLQDAAEEQQLPALASCSSGDLLAAADEAEAPAADGEQEAQQADNAAAAPAAEAQPAAETPVSVEAVTAGSCDAADELAGGSTADATAASEEGAMASPVRALPADSLPAASEAAEVEDAAAQEPAAAVAEHSGAVIEQERSVDDFARAEAEAAEFARAEAEAAGSLCSSVSEAAAMPAAAVAAAAAGDGPEPELASDDELLAPTAEDSGNVGFDAGEEAGELPAEADASSPRGEPPGSSIALEPPAGSDSPVQTANAAPSATAAALSHIRARKLSPMALVRESMPLFVSDPSRAMGRPLALEPGDDSLDSQDMQQLSAAGGGGWGSSGISRLGAAGAAAAGGSGGHTRLLAHGGPQRLAIGQAGAGAGFLSSLEPVEEAPMHSGSPSPIAEESPSFAGHTGGGGSSGGSSHFEEATSGDLAGDMSPLRPRHREGFNDALQMQVTPAPASGGGADGPDLGLTPGSTYSTPRMAMGPGAKAGGGGQAAHTPHSAVSSAVGSAIRGLPSSTSGGGGSGRQVSLSPAMHGLPDASPTLMLLPNLGGGGMGATPGTTAEGGDGSTPSLLDARAASPSAVYATRFMTTPFRGALAALPMDAALAAPLVDSSPCDLSDSGLDTVCLADEAQRVAQNLAAAAGGFGTTPLPARTQAFSQSAAAAPDSAGGGRGGGAESPTDELRDLHVVMLTKQLAEVQKRLKELEVDNLRLREQVEIYEFEKTELNSQEEMEKQARQYAEEQLQQLQVEIQQLMQAKSGQAAQMLAMRSEFEGIQQEAQRQHSAMKQQHAALDSQISQLSCERDQLLDRLNLMDMQATALRSNNSDLSAALEGQQQRCAELEAALAARDKDLGEAKARLEKAMEQMIAANTAKEHARQKAADEAAKVQQMAAERAQVMAEREKRLQDYQHLKHKYTQKSAALKEAEKLCNAREAENQELMAMCDQLLQQQEAGGRPAAT